MTRDQRPSRSTPASTRSSSRARPPGRPSLPGPPPAADRGMVEMTIDGAPGHRRRPAPRSCEACRAQGIDIPTLCYGQTLTPEGVCRLCVVDTGARALTPSCSAKVSQGMTVETDNEQGPPLAQARAGAAGLVGGRGPRRARPAGRVDRRVHGASTAPTRRGSARRRRPRRPASATPATPATTTRPTGPVAETVAQPVKMDNEPVRPRLRGAASSATSASRRAGWMPRTRSRSRSPAAASMPASPPSTTCPLAESACVFCGNCINVCPTGRPDVQVRVRAAPGGHLGRVAPDRDRHDLPVLRRGLHALAARPGQPHRQGAVARSTRRSRPATCA